MLVQSESEPMTFAICLVFKGELGLDSLKASVVEAALSHPLLTSCVRSSDEALSIYQASPKELTWVPSDLPPEINLLSLDDSGTPVSLNSQSDKFDLSRENGFKVVVSERGQETDVHFLFHHAVCDGLGGFKFVEEVLARYHATITKTEVQLTKVDAESLKLRNSNCETLLPWYRRLIRYGCVLPRRIFGMVGQTPAFVAAKMPTRESITNQPVSAALEMPSLTLSVDQTAAISQYAKTYQSSTNELLIHRLFKVLFEWNQNSAADERGKLRIIVPFSLRSSNHETMPAANCVSMVYVDAGNSPDGIGPLDQISKQIEYIRKWQIKYSWNQTASFAFRSKRLESLLRRQSGRHLCTTVLSNLGQPFKRSVLPAQEDGRLGVGDLTLQSVHIAAPTTTNTIVTFGVVFYAGRLTLTMNYNKAKMSRADAQTLMNLWSESLCSLS